MGHNVGKAAENAVNKSAKKTSEQRSTQQIIADLRKNLDARLAITSDDIRVLLGEYDRLVSEVKAIETIAKE